MRKTVLSLIIIPFCILTLAGCADHSSGNDSSDPGNTSQTADADKDNSDQRHIPLTASAAVNTEEKDGKYTITVNKATNCVTIYKANEKGGFEPYKAMICSVGADDSTPAGVFSTEEKYDWRLLFGDVYGQYATRVHGDILFHSVCYEEQSPDTLKTEEYNKLGTSASMGCIRLTAADAKWIYDNCSLGTQVTVADSAEDPLPRPEAIKLGSDAPYKNWDPTDPDPGNPWKKEGVKFKYENLHKKIKASDNLSSEQLAEVLRQGVEAYDTANNPMDYLLAYNISPTAKGRYDVTYYATDALGNYAEIKGSLVIV